MPKVSTMSLKLLFTASVLIILIISFYFHSPVFSPLYNSDNAIHVLMAYYLKLPTDLYFWGQDRLGSLVPIASHLLIMPFNLDPIYVVSIVQYLFLSVIFFTFASLLARTISKISLAIILFLPLSCFSELIQIGHPYTPSLVFIGIAMFILNRKGLWDLRVSDYKNTFLIFICGVVTFLSLWASETSIVMILPIGLYLFSVIFLRQPEFTTGFDTDNSTISDRFKFQLSKKALYPLAVFVAGCHVSISFIAYAKSHATKQNGYATQWFNNAQETREVCVKYFSNFIDVLTFNANDSYLSLAMLFFIVLLFSFRFLTREIKEKRSSLWIYFLLAAALHFLLVILAHWVYINDTPSRYSSDLYFILWLAVLLYVETFDTKKTKFIYPLILVISILTGLSSFVRFVYPLHKSGTYQTYKGIKSLAPAGLIGSYWNTYILASFNPSEIACAPHEGEFLRSAALLDSTSEKKTIYLIKNNWIKDFPPVLKQYGFWYKRKGESLTVGDFVLAPYSSSRTLVNKSVPGKLIYSASSLTTQCNNAEIAYEEGGEAVYTIDDAAVQEPCFLAFGPYINLIKGKYKIYFNVKVDATIQEGYVLTLDLYSNGTYLATRDLAKSDFAELNKFQVFSFELDNQQLIYNFETRVRYFGKGRIWFKGVEIETVR